MHDNASKTLEKTYPNQHHLPMNATRPLCVDLDGTLIYSDLLHESLFLVLRQRPTHMFSCFIWLMRGRAVLKHELAKRANIDVACLPFRYDVLETLKELKRSGRYLVLVTGSDQLLAKQVAEHLGLFEEVYGSWPPHNLVGEKKASFLNELFGHRAFDYVGDRGADLPIWKQAHTAHIVPPQATKRESLIRQLDEHTKHDSLTFATAHSSTTQPFAAFIRGCRPHQWAKNALLFVPMLAAHEFFLLDTWMACLVGFTAFSLQASAIYLLNDLLDVHADRRHHEKRHRPLAKGALPFTWAIAGLTMMTLAAWGLASFTNLEFIKLLGLYLAVNLAYNFGFKNMALLDVISLGSLYTLRLMSGAAATSTYVSSWLLAFSLFIFMSLAFCKRVTEMLVVQKSANPPKTRDYEAQDLLLVQQMGVTCGLMSIVVLGLYISNPTINLLYTFPQRLWLIVPVLMYWIGRVWLVTHRGHMRTDPVLFALKDPASYLSAITILAISIWAL